MSSAMTHPLERVLTSMDDVGEAYVAWNAVSPAWRAGPELVWRDGTYVPTEAAIIRTCTPVLYEIHASYAAAPLCGLASFRNVVSAELSFVQATDSPQNNASFLLTFWNEVLYALAYMSPITALQTVHPTQAGANERTCNNAAKQKAAAGATAMVHIAAHNGQHWIRLMPIRPDALMREFREYESTVSLSEPPAVDEAMTENSIVRLAHELKHAAAQTSSMKPTLEIILTRITLSDPGSLFDACPAPESVSYWTCPETVRMQRRLQGIADYAASLGVRITFGAHEPMPLHTPIPRPPSTSGDAPPPTQCINLDVSAMVAICSDLSHGFPVHVETHSNRALSAQASHERSSSLLQVLKDALGHTPTQLVATQEAIDKFASIVDRVASSREYERARWLLGSRRAPCVDEAWARLFPQSVQVIDDLFKANVTWSDTSYTCHLEQALDRLKVRRARPKSLSASPHTVHTLQMGLKKRITTLLAHSHGVQELLEEAGPITGSTLSHAVIWLIQPRSFTSSAPSSVSPRRSSSSSAELITSGKVGPSNSPPLISQPSASTMFPLPFLLTARRPAWNAWLKVWQWMQGPKTPKQHIIKHYPWWPWQHLEAAWLRWTASFAWKPPPSNDLPLWDSEETPSIELEPTNHMHTIPTPPPAKQGGTPGQRWWAKIECDWQRNWLHWIILCAVCIGWLFCFSVMVHYTWFSARILTNEGWRTPSPFTCTTTLWGRNDECGLDGSSCAPFSDSTMTFQCPSGCAKTTLLNPRTVGDQAYNYVPLVVGGSNSTPYRADSFICAAAQHAGVIGRRGGCGILRQMGSFTHFDNSTQNGIDSFPFPSVFPSSFLFFHPQDSQHCTDERWRLYIINVVFLAVLTFVVRPMPLFLFWTMSCVGFWHVNLVSELRSMPPPVGAAAGDFGPHLFVCFVIWHCALKHVWGAFQHVPLEFGIGWLGLWWIGVLLDVVFADVPLQRLTVHDISQQPGALSSLVIVVIVVVILAINQVRVIRSVGLLPKFLTLYIIACVVLGLCAAVPGEVVRIHHYVIGLALLPACGFPTRISMLCCAILFGMYINGVARWGFDGLLQDEGVVRGDAVGDSAIPHFSMNRTFTDQMIRWAPIPTAEQNVWSSFSLLVDDVLRYKGPATSFNLSSILSHDIFENSNLLSQSQVHQSLESGKHFLRLAYSSATDTGDFTKAAIAWFNGTFIKPPAGRT